MLGPMAAIFGYGLFGCFGVVCVGRVVRSSSDWEASAPFWQVAQIISWDLEIFRDRRVLVISIFVLVSRAQILMTPKFV